jgi:C4-dicarboxylate-specific signal transduction histidine kinase
MMLQRERNNKLMNLEAMAASISHEVKQPLAAIVMRGGAALRFLGRERPDLDEARLALKGIINEGRRASQIFDNLRVLFGKTGRAHEPIDVNEVTREALRTLRSDLMDHDITTRAELASELPLVMGHRGQLQEVIVNLVHNAIEAMDTVKDNPRVLQVTTEQHDGKIILAVEDSGPGIDPQKLESIFEAFVTTKPNGMGLGLAICRMIVEQHGGELFASPAHSRGSVFRIVLPAGTGRVTAAAD